MLGQIGLAIRELNTQSMKNVAKEDFKLLDIVHHLTSGVKAYATEMAYFGLDELRQACGGAGFLSSSGVGDWWCDLAPFPTFEGVNAVMFQQSSRLLLKNAGKVVAGKNPHKFFAYLTTLESRLAKAKASEATTASFHNL